MVQQREEVARKESGGCSVGRLRRPPSHPPDPCLPPSPMLYLFLFPSPTWKTVSNPVPLNLWNVYTSVSWCFGPLWLGRFLWIFKDPWYPKGSGGVNSTSAE